ncbi:MAG TPA: TolC family outer membrane protein [Burkholderiales bacterium]
MQVKGVALVVGVLGALFANIDLCCAETLGQAVESSMAWHPEVRAALANWRAVDATVAQARAGYFPSVDASVGQGRERADNPVTRPLGTPPTLTRSEASIGASQLLFDTGATSSDVRRTRARTESAYAQLATTAESVAFRTAQAFYEVIRLRALIALAEQNLSVHERTLDQVTRRSQAGVGRRSDDRQTAARLALAQSTLSQLRGQLLQAEAQYRNQTGHPAQDLAAAEIPFNALPASVQAAIDDAKATHPAVRSAKLDMNAALGDRDFARSRYGPRVTLELAATRNHDLDGVPGLNADTRAMLVVRQNLFRGGGDRARVREAEARRDQAGELLARVQNDLERDLRIAWEGLAADRARLPDLQRYAETSAEVVEAYRSQFGIGQRTLLDVLNAENELYSARSGFASGEAAVAVDVYRVLANMGRMLAQLGLRLPGGGGAPDLGGAAQ